MGDQNKNSPDPNQGLPMPDYGGGGMVPSSQVGVSLAQGGQCIPGLQNIAPGPPPHHPANLQQPSQLQQIHQGGAQHAGQGSMNGQQMALQQPIGQPQFVIQQPFGGQQYATFPQIAYANQQGQLVLQPAQFTIPGGPGQPQGQQVILTGVPQKPGQPQMISSSGGGPLPGKPGQPSYTISSTGQLQMPAPPGSQPQQTFMLANPMQPPNIQSSMQGQSIPGQTIPTSMAGMKGSDTKPIPASPQIPGQHNPQQTQFVMSSHGMTYMQGGHPQLIQQNGQLIFRSPAPPEQQQQQVMFSPSGPPPQQPQPAVQHPNGLSNPNNPLGGMQIAGPGPRPTLPVVGPPPGKTAISRAIAPLPSNTSQTNARIGYVTGNNNPGQPSPKSKQKMSPRNNQNGVGRPPAPKGVSGMKMMPRMAGGAVNLPHPGSPGSPHIQVGSPRPPISSIPLNPATSSAIGPPTLSPMMGGGEGAAPTLPTISVTASVPLSQMSKLVTSTPVPSLAACKPRESALDPPTLTKEIMTPMPSLGQPNLQKSLGPGITVSKPLTTTTTFSTMSGAGEGEPGLTPTPKAVVKPQVLTHVIDGHVIKESSQPFPVSPVKATARRKPEKSEEKTQGVKRGPGRPPGSNKTAAVTDTIKSNGSLEPPEKKMKAKENVPATPPPPPAPVSLPPPSAALLGIRGNPLKWNVTEVCDFIKNLPGCAEYVEDFAQQEIDGQALMLLKADHLMSAMSIKLGPALKICSHITQIREELNKT